MMIFPISVWGLLLSLLGGLRGRPPTWPPQTARHTADQGVWDGTPRWSGPRCVLSFLMGPPQHSHPWADPDSELLGICPPCLPTASRKPQVATAPRWPRPPGADQSFVPAPHCLSPCSCWSPWSCWKLVCAGLPPPPLCRLGFSSLCFVSVGRGGWDILTPPRVTSRTGSVSCLGPLGALAHPLLCKTRSVSSLPEFGNYGYVRPAGRILLKRGCSWGASTAAQVHGQGHLTGQ